MLIDKDALLAAINALPDASTSDGDLSAQLQAAKDALAQEDAKDVDLQNQVDAANAKIAAVKAALGL